MKWFALFGLVLFLGVAVAPGINGTVNVIDANTSSIDTINEKEQ